MRRSLLLVAVVCLWQVERVPASVVLDQHFDPPTVVGGGVLLGSFGFTSLAQTFGVGITGTLDHVEIFSGAVNRNQSVDLLMSINATIGGVPTDTVLAQTVIPAGTMIGSFAWRSVDFAPFDVSVNSGDKLALVLSLAPGQQQPIGWLASGSVLGQAQYVGGEEYAKSSLWFGNSNWNLFTSTFGPTGETLPYDCLFRTYVQPVPEPSALAVWSLLSVVGVGYGRWRKRRS